MGPGADFASKLVSEGGILLSWPNIVQVLADNARLVKQRPQLNRGPHFNKQKRLQQVGSLYLCEKLVQTLQKVEKIKASQFDKIHNVMQ